MEQLARDLDRALGGTGHAEVSPRHPARESVGPAPGGTLPRSRMADALVAAMNRERAVYGLRPLKSNGKLALAATDRVADMLSKHYFEHVSPDGIDPFSWMDKRGYEYREAGENLAVGYSTADSIVDGWMHSPEHRRNVLGADFDEVGVAISASSPSRAYAAPLVVAMYGTR